MLQAAPPGGKGSMGRPREQAAARAMPSPGRSTAGTAADAATAASGDEVSEARCSLQAKGRCCWAEEEEREEREPFGAKPDPLAQLASVVSQAPTELQGGNVWLGAWRLCRRGYAGEMCCL